MKISKAAVSNGLLILIILLFITGIIVTIAVFRSNPVEDAIAANRIINTLVVIEENGKPLSTYVIMYYPATGRAAIFDIPGEIGLLIARINRVERIDAVYVPGRIANYQDEIQKLLGIDINFNIVITKENLVSMVDILEGVEIFIPSPISYRDEDEDILILFPSGITVLDGDKAVLYATYILPDETREAEIFRRQRFFQGLLNRWIIMNESLKERNASRLYYSFFNTNMNQRTLMRLFDEFENIDPDRTNIQSVAGNLREVSGQMLIIPHWDGNLIKEIVRQTMEMLTREIDDPYSERLPTVEVLNGTTITGRAGRTADIIRNFGYEVVNVGNADRNDFENTLITHRLFDEAAVQTFANIIRCTNIRQELDLDDVDSIMNLQSSDRRADITLIIGRDFDGRFVTENN